MLNVTIILKFIKTYDSYLNIILLNTIRYICEFLLIIYFSVKFNIRKNPGQTPMLS